MKESIQRSAFQVLHDDDALVLQDGLDLDHVVMVEVPHDVQLTHQVAVGHRFLRIFNFFHGNLAEKISKVS